jgi:hypothetical protein
MFNHISLLGQHWKLELQLLDCKKWLLDYVQLLYLVKQGLSLL